MSDIAFSGVTVQFGAVTLLRNVSFTVDRGERWGVIGRNGSGKTTLFKMITGDLEPSAGSVVRTSGLRISLLDQHRELGGASTVWDAAAGPLRHIFELEQSLLDQSVKLGELGDASTPAMYTQYDRDLERFERDGGYQAASRVDATLQGLGFDAELARTQRVATLSGGERGRLALARQLVAPADILLLDEPTNHLDLETSRWLEGYLRGIDATVLVVSHDRAFLQAIVEHVLHLESGTAIPYAGDYETFVAQRAERRLAADRAYTQQRKTIAAEEDFIRRNIAGNNSSQAKGRRRRLDRVARLSPPPGEDDAMALRLTSVERGGDQVLVVDDVSVGVEDRVLLKDFSSAVRRGDVIGLLGSNGTGKSTLVKSLVGERAVIAGEVRRPDSIRIAYYRQDLAQVPTEKTIYDTIADLEPQWGRGAVQGHLGRFGFTGDAVLRRVGSLSGGERARLALAMMMLVHANLLIFDEPTNHLDVESIEALEDAIDGYEGTVILVSHDRALLDALVTRVWSLENGRIHDFGGTFAEWQAMREDRARKASEAQRDAQRAAQRAAKNAPKKEVKPKTSSPERQERAASREAQRRLDEAESAVARHESRVTELSAALADGALYETSDGARRATDLAAELASARQALERALEQWSAAMESAPNP